MFSRNLLISKLGKNIRVKKKISYLSCEEYLQKIDEIKSKCLTFI